MEKPGILFIINEVRLGGAEVFLLRLAKALQSDYRIFILDRRPHVADPDFKVLFEQAGVTFLEERPLLPPFLNHLFWKCSVLASFVGIQELHRKWNQAWQRRQLLKSLRRHHIRFLHSHSYSADVLGFWLKKKTNLPWMITMHGDYNLANIAGLSPVVKQEVEAHLKSFLSCVQVLTYVGAPNIAWLPSLGVERLPSCQQISLGLDPVPAFVKASNLPFTFCMVARATASKGWEVAIEAFKKVHARFPETRLVLVGPLEDALGQLHQKHADDASIVFTGLVKEASPYLKESHVGLLPSWFPSESTPYSLIEYLAHGLPVIVTRHGDMASMIQAGSEQSAGLLISDVPNVVPSVERCAEAMEQLITDSILYERLAENAQKAFLPFSMEHCGKAYKAIYARYVK